MTAAELCRKRGAAVNCWLINADAGRRREVVQVNERVFQRQRRMWIVAWAERWVAEMRKAMEVRNE